MRKSVLTAAFAAVSALAVAGGSGLAFASAPPVPVSAPYTWSGTDNGTCQNTWALDLGNRTFTEPAPSAPSPGGGYLYSVSEKFINGNFSTFAGMSPGACGATGGGTFQTPPGNGHRVKEGLRGWFTGVENLVIQNGVWNAQDGSCAGTPGVSCSTSAYVAYHYGSVATYSITTWNFIYHTSDKSALGKYFKEQGSPQVYGGAEVDTGDIYTSAVI